MVAGGGTSKEKTAEHDSQLQYLTYRVSFINPWGGNPRGKYHILDRGQNYNKYITFYHPDINECAVQDNLCDVANSECNNTHGSYYCQCNDGFVKNGAICEGAI